MFYNVWENLKIKFYNLSHPQDDFVPAGTTPLSAPKSSSGFSFSLPELKLSSLRDAPFETKRIIVLIFVFLASILILSFLRASFYSYSASAVSKSDLRSGILFYDRDWTPSSDSGGIVGCASISGGPAAEKVWNGLISLGLTEEQAAGIMGNMQHESKFNPAQHEIEGGINAYQPGFDISSNAGVAYGLGLCQWSFDRRVNVYRHVASQEPSLTHYLDDYRKYSNGFISGDQFISLAGNDNDVNRLIELELNFLKQELDSSYSGFYSNSSTVSAAAEWFLMNFEKPANASSQIPERTGAAQGYYDRFHGSTGGGGGGDASSSSSSNNSCSATTVDGNVIFYQTQEPWGSMPYGDCGGATIGDAGCGPTSLAMAITAMTGRTVYPQEVAQKAVAVGHRVCGEGSSWAITTLATQYGLQVTTTSWNEGAITEVLRRGGMVQVAGSGSNPFTEGGHFIVIRGITNSGNWLIFDSSHEGSDNNSREWNPGEIMSAAWKIGTPYVITK